MIKFELHKSHQSLEKKLAQIEVAEFLSLDTEFIRRKSFFAKPALLQIKFDSQILLIDLISIKDSSIIKHILSLDNPKKIIHSASEDLQIFYHSYNSKLENFFDTQIMGYWLLDENTSPTKSSYAKLVKLAVGIELEKSQTQSNWLKRPLSQSQLNYAAEDVDYLADIYIFLAEQPRSAKRVKFGDFDLSFFDIAKDESDYLANHLSRVYKYATDYRLYDMQGKLTSEELAHLSAINDWRLEAAKLHNLPIKWILSDAKMLNLVKNKAMYKRDFLESDQINSVFIRKYGNILLKLLSQNLKSLDKFKRTISSKNEKLKNLSSAWSKKIAEFEQDFSIRENSLISNKTKYLILLDFLTNDKIKKSYNLPAWRLEALKQTFPY